MPGRAALTDIAGARSDIRSIQQTGNPAGAGDATGEYSAIGGQGRQGSDAYGNLMDPAFTRIDAQLVGRMDEGLATKGMQGNGYGVGRTFAGGGSRRSED